ncbi:hypothetical protein BV918_12645 [Pectobacterium odoriferum]|nr:hypothetical protein BCS7_04965 [Pectobacterium odoriferum]POE17534.1 hypothetical protein BV918_12645 [Pectobacterium odoriferum]POE35000.1 hypothetical protein BV922_11270 [Pectobacterium odoriferum]
MCVTVTIGNKITLLHSGCFQEETVASGRSVVFRKKYSFQEEIGFQDEIRDTSRKETESRLGISVGQEPKGIESWKIQDGNVRKKVGRQQGLWVRMTKKEKFSRMSRDANV